MHTHTGHTHKAKAKTLLINIYSSCEKQISRVINRNKNLKKKLFAICENSKQRNS